MVLTQSGRQRLATGDRESAARDFREAIRLSPDFADAQYSLGVALSGTEGALDAFATSLSLNPRRADAQYQIALIQQAAGRNDAAIHSLREAVTLEPCNIEVKQALGRALIAAGDYPAGREELDDARALKNEGP
jgi:tetratricopeptide (TPR) repeat protein